MRVHPPDQYKDHLKHWPPGLQPKPDRGHENHRYEQGHHHPTGENCYNCNKPRHYTWDSKMPKKVHIQAAHMEADIAKVEGNHILEDDPTLTKGNKVVTES